MVKIISFFDIVTQLNSLYPKPTCVFCEKEVLVTRSYLFAAYDFNQSTERTLYRFSQVCNVEIITVEIMAAAANRILLLNKWYLQ